MQTPRVVIAGHVCIDHNQTEGVSYTKWGSPAMYVADYLRAYHHLATTIITAYGPDFMAFSEGVRLLPEQPPMASSLVFRNIVTATHREWYSENVAVAIPPILDNDAISSLQSADIFLLGTLLPNYPPEYVHSMMQHLPRSCLKGLIVQGYLRHVTADSKIIPRDFIEADAILPLFDVAVLSDEDHPDAVHMVQEWAPNYPHTAFIVTQGSQGATVFQGHITQPIPTTPVAAEQIVDSVGCGDVFAAALLYRYQQGGNLPKAVRYAHRAARAKLRGAVVA